MDSVFGQDESDQQGKKNYLVVVRLPRTVAHPLRLWCSALAWSAQGGPSASTTFEAVQSWLVSKHQQKRPGRHLAYTLEALRWQSGASLKSAWCGWSLRQMCDGRMPGHARIVRSGRFYVPGSEETGGGPPATSIIDDRLGGFMKSWL